MDAELNAAADSGNSVKLKELLGILRLPQKQEEWLRRTLIRATYECRATTVATLLECKANPSWTDERNEAALHWASRKGHTDIAKNLLKFKAEVNQATPDGTTALHLASEQNKGPFVKLLLISRADVIKVTREKRAPLFVAADNGCEAAATELLRPDPIYDDIKNPALEIANDRGETPLARSAVKGHTACLKQLLRARAYIEAKNWWGQGPLQLASQGGHVECVAELLECRGDFENIAQDGTTALHSSCEKGHEKVVQLLLEARASCERRAAGGRTPVHGAALRGNPEVMKVLCEHGVNIEDRTEEGRTPLACAASRGNSVVCRLLLENSADPQALDSVRQTPLHAAAANGKVDTVEVLLDGRARLEPVDGAARTPIMLAHNAQHEAVVRALLKRGASLPDNFSGGHGFTNIVKEVERERLQEMVREAERGKGAQQMKIAERAFEDARINLLELSDRLVKQFTAPAVHDLEIKLVNIAASSKQTIEAEAELQKEVAKYSELLKNAQNTKDKGEKDTKANQLKAEEAKATMLRKQNALFDIRKQIREAETERQKHQKKIDALEAPLADAIEKKEGLEGESADLEAQFEDLTAQLAKVKERIAWWHEQRREAAALHAQAQDLLNKEKVTPGATPREHSA